MNPKDFPHRRWNPLRKEWILVSPHRATRPWQGAEERLPPASLPHYDPACYLCPGNIRSSGLENPNYPSVFTFSNDFAALTDTGCPADERDLDGIIRSVSCRGMCRVVCFSPRHDLTIPEMSVEAISMVLLEVRNQFLELGSIPWVKYVAIFENKGAIMGCSNPHPHGQIWATEEIPQIPLGTISSQREHFAHSGKVLLLEYLRWELERDERIVCANSDFVALVPFWAVWPFEAMILPREWIGSLKGVTPTLIASWAAILKEVTQRYDLLFNVSFPYSMGVLQAPTDGTPEEGILLHQVFYPPLLRSATVRKYMVGFELTGEPQRDITPEQAAERLRTITLIRT